MNKTLVIGILFFFISITSFGQYNRGGERGDRISVGLGPSFLYGDNTGIHSEFKFKILPVVSGEYITSFNDFIDIKATLGWQMINSGDYYDDNLIKRIAEDGYPHAFKGNLFFADVMPYYIFNPDRRGFVATAFKFYSGLGVGVFHSMRTDKKRVYEGDNYIDIEYKDSDTHVYFPLRVGSFFRIPDTYNDLGIEGSLLISPFGNMEGNGKQQKAVNADIAVQLQVYYKFYLW
ncbi:hypothetical protein [Shivajiella indica]|uniref:Outer membrane protein beta-barrel domain-containing protein n=1 Tax=Shivajiella indica TaxID=872115 RepID=A0ABW5B6F2_9BACT